MNDTRRRMAVPLLPGMRMQDPRSFAKPRTQTLAVKNGVHGVYKLPQDAIPMEEAWPYPKTDRPQTADPNATFASTDANLDHLANLTLNTTMRGAAGRRSAAGVPRFTNENPMHGQADPEENVRRSMRTDPEFLERPRTAGGQTDVLRFFAYLEEQVLVGALDLQKRVRTMHILFYLEDGSIQVTEPRGENSGIAQGAFLKRMRVPRDPPRGGSRFVNLEDLMVGKKVSLFARQFHITGCDQFTRSFLTREGVKVPDNTDIPVAMDELYLYMPRKEEKPKATGKGPIRAKMGEAEMAKLKKFMEHDGHVLRFFATQDTRAEDPLDGERRSFIVHYFLADDTIEILEVVERNSGRDPFPKLLKRIKLPKEVYSLGGRPMSELTKKRIGAGREYYTENDLKIGGMLNVYNRMLLLHDCDAFTKQFYIEQRGRSPDEFRPVLMESVPAVPVIEPPPHNGIGSEEDSKMNCYSLQPKPPTKDMKHFQEMDGKKMSFAARIVDDPLYPLRNDVDGKRDFVLTFYVVDGTMGIYEPMRKNSGLAGRKYLERMRVKKPTATPLYYQMQDLYMGARLTIHARVFELVEADPFTHEFMAKNAAVFWRSDPLRVLQAVQADLRLPCQGPNAERIRDAMVAADAAGEGSLSEAALRVALETLGSPISAQEVHTLRTAFGNTDGSVDIARLLETLGVM